MEATIFLELKVRSTARRRYISAEIRLCANGLERPRTLMMSRTMKARTQVERGTSVVKTEEAEHPFKKVK